MKYAILLLCIGITGVGIGCKPAVSSNPSFEYKEMIRKRVKESIDERVRKGINPSIIMGVIDSTGIDIYAQGVTTRDRGGEKPNEFTLYEIGSITKVFTGLLLAEQVVNGKIRLTDSIRRFLPDSLRVDDSLEAIHLKQLATHSSGVKRLPSNLHSAGYNPANPYAHYTGDLLMEELEEHSLLFEPGEASRYSNFGMGMLGYVLSEGEGESYVNSLIQHVLAPLNMNYTSTSLAGNNTAKGYVYEVPVDPWDFEALAGAGALTSNVYDMLFFLAAQLGLTETALQPAIQLSQQSHFQVEEGKSIGLAWGMYQLDNGDTLYRHNGGTGGFRSFVGFLKRAKKGVIVLTNSSQAGVDDLGLHQLGTSFELLTDFRPSIAKQVSGILEHQPLDTFREMLAQQEIDSLNTDWGELNLLGYTYLKKREIKKAIQAFELNVELYSHSADGWDSLGEAYYEGRQLDESLRCYRKALEINPNYLNASKMIEQIHVQMKRKSNKN